MQAFRTNIYIYLHYLIGRIQTRVKNILFYIVNLVEYYLKSMYKIIHKLESKFILKKLNQCLKIF